MGDLRQYLDAMVASAVSDWRRGIREKTHHDDIDRIVSQSGYALRMSWGASGRADWMWCGMFCAAHAGIAGMSRFLRPGLWHVKNVEDFFQYKYGSRVPDIAVFPASDDGPRSVVLHELHEERNSLRRWITNEDIEVMVREDGPALVGFTDDDIVGPGDILLVDTDGNGSPNHITMVKSYFDGVITTVEGNAGGLVCVKENGSDVTTTRVKGDAVALNARDLSDSSARRRIYGIGRFSLLDFEHKNYDIS